MIAVNLYIWCDLCPWLVFRVRVGRCHYCAAHFSPCCKERCTKVFALQESPWCYGINSVDHINWKSSSPTSKLERLHKPGPLHSFSNKFLVGHLQIFKRLQVYPDRTDNDLCRSQITHLSHMLVSEKQYRSDRLLLFLLMEVGALSLNTNLYHTLSIPFYDLLYWDPIHPY